MANKRIDQLGENLNPLTGGELIPIFDVVNGTTERITLTTLSNYIDQTGDTYITGGTFNSLTGVLSLDLNDGTSVNVSGITSTYKFSTSDPTAIEPLLGNNIVYLGDYQPYNNSNFSNIGGGYGNVISASTRSTIGNGYFNTIKSNYTTTSSNSILGGSFNTLYNGYSAEIVGGYRNTIEKGGWTNSIVGGYNNRIVENSNWGNFIGNGGNNTISSSKYNNILGGIHNSITNNNFYSTIVGGNNNSISGGNTSNIVGGRKNRLNSSSKSTIGGGYYNRINNGDYNTILGGYRNLMNNSFYSVILDGFNNEISNAGFVVSILGGYANKIKKTTGGYYNTNWNSIQGGGWNKIYDSNPFNFGDINGGNVIGGGSNNFIYGNSNFGSNKNNILNGSFNKISGSTSSMIGNGYKNEIGSLNHSSIIGNGLENKITDGLNVTRPPLLPYNSPGIKPTGALGNVIGGGGRNTIKGTVKQFVDGNHPVVYGPYFDDGKFNTIAGGYRNYIFGQYNTIGGGGRTMSTFLGFYEGGNIISGNSSTISGGLGHIIKGRYSTIGGGGFYDFRKRTFGNTIIGNMSAISGGFNNKIDTSPWYDNVAFNAGNSISIIGGGSGHRIEKGRFSWSTIGGGSYNYIRTGGSFIGGGGSNTIGAGLTVTTFPNDGYRSFIGAGYNNTIYSDYSNILGGKNNNILTNSKYSSIVGGQSNNVNHTNAHIIGSNITSVSANTTHVERLNIKTVNTGTGSTSSEVLVRESNGMVNTKILPSKGYLSYEALVIQTGTTAPIATILTNELNGVPVWSRSSVGDYRLTLNGAFTTNKTVIILGNKEYTLSTTSIDPYDIVCGVVSVNEIYIDTVNNSGLVDGKLGKGTVPLYVEIRVYN